MTSPKISQNYPQEMYLKQLNSFDVNSNGNFFIKIKQSLQWDVFREKWKKNGIFLNRNNEWNIRMSNTSKAIIGNWCALLLIANSLSYLFEIKIEKKIGQIFSNIPYEMCPMLLCDALILIKLAGRAKSLNSSVVISLHGAIKSCILYLEICPFAEILINFLRYFPVLHINWLEKEKLPKYTGRLFMNIEIIGPSSWIPSMSQSSMYWLLFSVETTWMNDK